MQQLFGGRPLRPQLVPVMHPLEPLEGGLTHVEVRVLRELGAAAGGRDVFVWTGRELGDDELHSGVFAQDRAH